MAITADTLLFTTVGTYSSDGTPLTDGAVQATGKLMATLYQKPVSSTQYVAYLINNSGLTKSAFAQGSGWDFLNNTSDATGNSPLLKLWTYARNISYVFFIVIFVAIGFMIMFRSKLNPQTAVSVQMALPGIIMSLILVTFSFAICGLIIDFVFIGHNLINAVYFSDWPLKSAYVTTNYIGDVFQIDILTALLGASSTTWGGVSVFNTLGAFITDMGDELSSGDLIGTILPLIFAFTLLGVGLKIFFALITKYATIILSTIFSPFVFLMSAFPGRSEGISNFIKTMLSATLTFPAISFMFYLASYFASEVNLTLNALPPLNKEGILATDPTAVAGTISGMFGGRVLEPLIALGLLMATTQVPQAIDQALGVKPGIAGAATPEIGGALSKIPIIGSLLH